jgi:hypothetical protein
LEHIIELYVSAVREESLDILEDFSIKLFSLHFLTGKYFARKSYLHFFSLKFNVQRWKLTTIEQLVVLDHSELNAHHADNFLIYTSFRAHSFDRLKYRKITK